MKPEQKKIIGLLALALPFVAMLAMVGMNAQNLSHKEYRFQIEGYDPRDLLRGHYMIFNYVWPEHAQESAKICQENDESCCACINGETQDPQVAFMVCARAATEHELCQATLPMADSTQQPHENLRQYYIPEAQAAHLESWLRSEEHKFEVGIVPLPGGEGAQLKMMYVDGKALPVVLQELPRSEPAP